MTNCDHPLPRPAVGSLARWCPACGAFQAGARFPWETPAVVQSRPRGKPTVFPSPWREMAQKAGGVRELAAALGVDVRTAHRWATGHAMPDEDTRNQVKAWARSKRLTPPWKGK